MSEPVWTSETPQPEHRWCDGCDHSVVEPHTCGPCPLCEPTYDRCPNCQHPVTATEDTRNPNLLSITEDEYGHLMCSLAIVLSVTKDGGIPVEQHDASHATYTRLFHAGVQVGWVAEDGTLRGDL